MRLAGQGGRVGSACQHIGAPGGGEAGAQRVDEFHAKDAAQFIARKLRQLTTLLQLPGQIAAKKAHSSGCSAGCTR